MFEIIKKTEFPVFFYYLFFDNIFLKTIIIFVLIMNSYTINSYKIRISNKFFIQWFPPIMSSKIAFTCPICHSYQNFTPLKFDWCMYDEEKNPCYLLGVIDKITYDIKLYEYLYKCENPKCNSFVIRICRNNQEAIDETIPKDYWYFDFSSYPFINKISPIFQSLFNQSFKAEQLWCKDIAWPWYRKAVEFLVKDYIIKTGKWKKEDVESRFVSKCIKNFINDDRIKKLSKWAFWFGNNKTHYYSEWNGDSLKELKDIIILLCHYIESDLYSCELLNKVPEKILNN